MNTIISLTGSCLATFVVSALIREKFNMEDILNATLAGGVAIGAPAGVTANPAASMVVGILAGAISVLCYKFLTTKLEEWVNLYDTCGVNNLHGIPGILGGLSSAVIIVAYGNIPLTDPTQISQLGFYSALTADGAQRNFQSQALFQIAGTFSSMAMGILFGFAAGLICRCFYSF